MQPRQISKTVQQRQLKRMSPRHYETLIRLLNGQSHRKIARELGLGEQRLSVIINSPVFQEELRKRWEVREQTIIQRFRERETRRIEAVTAMMRDGVGDTSILDGPSFVDGFGKRRRKPHEDQNGLGEIIIKEINRMREDENKSPTEKPPEVESTPSTPEPKEPEPFLPTTADPVINIESLAVEAADRGDASTGFSKVQAARFYSQVLSEWVWLVFEYPGQRLAYGEAHEILRLRNGSKWKIYPRPFVPSDGYACYSAEDICQLRGKAPERYEGFTEPKRRR